MKRRIMITMAVAVFAVLAMASVAQAASVAQSGTAPKPTGLTAADGRGLSGSHLLAELQGQEPDERAHHPAPPRGLGHDSPTDQLVGIPVPWTSDGSRTLGLRYGNGGYWQGTVNLVITHHAAGHARRLDRLSLGRPATAPVPPRSPDEPVDVPSGVGTP